MSERLWTLLMDWRARTAAAVSIAFILITVRSQYSATAINWALLVVRWLLILPGRIH
ncbi:hypothetical protein [Nonomuraea turkmeniaca]|uniref:hypothetical protein n=1 Tax=Nonomuraea turkmeniaca TaxID=103838 RepID=UPI001476F455|nr:hypothetical protein [Nonomuraea turkmeniaca]